MIRRTAHLLLLALLPALTHASVYLGTQTSTSDILISGSTLDNRCQFILPAEEIGAGWSCTQYISHLSFFVSACDPAMEYDLTLRLRNLETGEFSSTDFINDNLTTVIDGRSLSVPTTAVDGYWPLSFDTVFSYTNGANLLVDLCIEVATIGSNIELATWPVSHNSLLRMNGNLVSGDLCDYTSGTAYSFLPHVVLGGLNRILDGDLTIADSPLTLASGGYTIPDGDSLCVFPGVEILCDRYVQIKSYGGLRARGTAETPIVFAASGDEDWYGLQIETGDVLKHVEITEVQGAALTIDEGSLESPVLENLRLYGNEASSSDAGVIIHEEGSLRLQGVQMDHNLGQALLVVGDTPGTVEMKNCLVVQNTSNPGYENLFARVYPACNLEFRNCSIANNSEYSAILHVDSDLFQCALSNTGTEFIGGGSLFQFEYCLSEDDFSSFYSSVVSWDRHCLQASPQFVDPSGMDYHPANGSPLIDAGRPQNFDPDLSIADIGALYHDQAVPEWISLSDVEEDQGRELLLAWEAASTDLLQTPAVDCFYTVWRQDEAPAARALVCADLAEAAEQIARDPQITVCVRDTRDQVWTYLAQVPSRQTESYGLVAATLHDVSPTQFQICWHQPGHFASSTIEAGISLDNVAPDAPRGVRITESAGTSQLVWDAVSTGTNSEGRVLEELGEVNYRVYYSTEPWFVPGYENLISETTLTSITITIPAAPSRGFYKVMAVDEPLY